MGIHKADDLLMCVSTGKIDTAEAWLQLCHTQEEYLTLVLVVYNTETGKYDVVADDDSYHF